MGKRKVIQLIDIGLCHYDRAMEVQNAAFLRAANSETVGVRDAIITCDHYPVYTFGNRQKKGVGLTKLPAPIKYNCSFGFYKKWGLVTYTQRGGLETVHSPGQLIAYFVIDVRPSIRVLVRGILEAAAEACRIAADLPTTIEYEDSAHVGLWTADRMRKLGSLGLNCSRHYSKHGISINCCNDLSWYGHIRPCGLDPNKMSTLSKELGRIVKPEVIRNELLKCLASKFSFEYTQ